jgi:DNA-binding MarR family transcriptional regulator
MSPDATRTPTSSASSINESATIRRLSELFQAFGSFYKRWVHDRIESEVGFTHRRALGELAFHGPMMMNALGQELCVTPRYVTALVDALETDGLVRRRPHPADRRAILVELTDHGAAEGAEATSVLDRVHQELLSVLTPAQQESLLSCLETLLAELQRRAPAVEPPSAA